MRMQERIVDEMNDMSQRDLSIVYDLILRLKKRDSSHPTIDELPPHVRVRNALEGTKGSLGEDIVRLRDDRI